MTVRLRGAAMALFAEQGYDRTTAAQIAAAAGVTERTFFRYFPDKREVLFDREPVVRETLVDAVAAAAPGSSPLAILHDAFRAFEPMLTAHRDYAAPRDAIIAATPALRERELAKTAALAEALAAALRDRRVDDLAADLAAQAGVAAFVHVTRAWLRDPATDHVAPASV